MIGGFIKMKKKRPYTRWCYKIYASNGHCWVGKVYNDNPEAVRIDFVRKDEEVDFGFHASITKEEAKWLINGLKMAISKI